MLIVDTYHMIRDAHYFDRGFDGWWWIRGQEHDRYMTNPTDDPAERKKAAKPVTPAKGKKRGRKKMTLAQHVAKILAGAKEPMSPQDIGKILRAKGVSKAKSLTVQIGQVLSSDKVSVRKIGRGKYVAAK